MNASDAHRLGYRDVDGDEYTEVLVANMDATAGWAATQRLRAWEREQLAVASGERLLDVGCGRGEVAISLATELGSRGVLVGVDASDAMLDVARRRSSGLQCSVRFARGDARSLDEDDSAFDIVRSERTLQWLPEPEQVVAELLRVLRRGGRLSLVDTDWSTLQLDVGNPRIMQIVTDGLRDERRRPSNIGRRLGALARAAGCSVVADTSDTQTWERWDPGESPAPDGCFSMASLAEGLVESGHLEPGAVADFVDEIHTAARRRRFAMSLTMHAVVATRA